jgi:cation transporter-like permease
MCREELYLKFDSISKQFVDLYNKFLMNILSFISEAFLLKAIMNFLKKSKQYIVSNKEINIDMNSNKASFDNPAFDGKKDDHIFTVNGKIRSNSNSSQTFKNKNLSERRLSKRLSIIRRTSDDPDLVCIENPLRRQMSFIKDTSGEEPLLRSTIQILIASLCAGFGNVGAGVVLDIIQNWTVFIDITEMFVLVPSLLGLKGNLEMTMASRLSTEANLGHMEKWSTTLRMIGGDMVLVQCQAIVVSFLAAIVAILVNVCQTGTFDLDKCLVICASSLITANVACFLLGIHLTKLLRIHGITHSHS